MDVARLLGDRGRTVLKARGKTIRCAKRSDRTRADCLA